MPIFQFVYSASILGGNGEWIVWWHGPNGKIRITKGMTYPIKATTILKRETTTPVNFDRLGGEYH